MLLYVYISKYIFWLYISIYTHISLYSNKYMYFFLIYIYIYINIFAHLYIYIVHIQIPKFPAWALGAPAFPPAFRTGRVFLPVALCAPCVGGLGITRPRLGDELEKTCLFCTPMTEWMKWKWHEMKWMKWNGMEWNDSMIDWMNECMIAWMNDWMNEWWYIVMIVIGVWWE